MALLLFLCIDYYVLQALLNTFQNFPSTFLYFLTLLYWTITFITIVGYFYVKFTNFSPQLIRTGIFANYFSKIFTVLFLFIGDIIGYIQLGIQKITLYYADSFPQDPSAFTRPDVLAKAGLAAGTVPFTAISYGVLRGAYNFKVHHIDLPIHQLPPAFEGLRIAQISDVHAGTFIFKSGVKKGVKLLMEQNADVIFFTGDLINHKISEVDPYLDVFNKIQAPLGVYAILGNHDYKHPKLRPSKEEQETHIGQLSNVITEQLGWDLLMNENRVLEKEGQRLAIIGVENWGDLRWMPREANLDKALEGVEEESVKLLLSHDPSHWNKIVTTNDKYKDIDVTFAGHTHGMQFGIEWGKIKWSPVQYYYKQWAGLYEKKDQFIYVNRGFGCVAFPGRIGIPPEITVFTLKNASSH